MLDVNKKKLIPHVLFEIKVKMCVCVCLCAFTYFFCISVHE